MPFTIVDYALQSTLALGTPLLRTPHFYGQVLKSGTITEEVLKTTTATTDSKTWSQWCPL